MTDNDREQIEQPKAKWVPLTDFLGVMMEAHCGRWTWMRNMKCKYVELRVDMRDGMCLIKDRNGNNITPEQLAYQLYVDGEAAEIGRGMGDAIS